jgi:hypothetical protein
VVATFSCARECFFESPQEGAISARNGQHAVRACRAGSVSAACAVGSLAPTDVLDDVAI